VSEIYRFNPGQSRQVTVTDAGVVVPSGPMPLILLRSVTGGAIYVRLGPATMVAGDLVSPTIDPNACDTCVPNGAYNEAFERLDYARIGFITEAGVTAIVELTPAQAVRP
jgi:hypothetical protein